MHTDFVPVGPWLNPVIDDGIYDATIEEITEGTYGHDKNPFLRLVLWLTEPAVYLVTNFYKPKSSRSQYRLHYLCRCVDCELQDVFETPHRLARRELRVEVQVTKPHDGVGRLYSDVKAFIPPEGNSNANEELVQEAKNKYEGLSKLV